jgi:hypothetical protein
LANQLTTGIAVVVLTDGVSSTFSFDLLKDQYFLFSNVDTPAEAKAINWFASDPKCNAPTSVNSSAMSVPGGGGLTYTASLSGTVVTITFSAAPPVNGYGLNVYPIY